MRIGGDLRVSEKKLDENADNSAVMGSCVICRRRRELKKQGQQTGFWMKQSTDGKYLSILKLFFEETVLGWVGDVIFGLSGRLKPDLDSGL